ncbi:hypothetical protein DXT87_18040 [Arthrobacter sp. AET 35A]|nr:hypothetical protein [Arthrobacter sp. AET 35A]
MANTKIMKLSRELRQVVKLLEEVDAEAHDAARDSFPSDYSPLYNFDQAMLVRGINTLKSVRILVEAGHWEMANALLRQLLELVANIEYLSNMLDRDDAALQYVRYGLLQKVQQQALTLEYNENSGRSIDTTRLAELQSALSGSAFDEFKATTKDGSLKFVASWCRRNMTELCEASSNPLRMHQYKLLYSPWSEQVHATPGALIDAIMRTSGPGWEQAVMETDETQIHEAVSMAVTLFVELRGFLPAIQAPDPTAVSSWMERVKPKSA